MKTINSITQWLPKTFLCAVAAAFFSTAVSNGALWDNNPVRKGEPILFLSGKNNTRQGKLRFAPTKLLRAYTLNPQREIPVSDFSIKGNTLIYKGKETIPHWKESDFISQTQDEIHPQPHADGRRYIMYGGAPLFANRQILFDYETNERWDGPIPENQSARLPRLQEKIKAKAPITLTILGDSISQGCDATAWGNVPPYAPPYRDLLTKALSNATGGAFITQHNLAVGGTSAEWGVSQIEAVIKTKPDLFVIAFGMNDSSAPRTTAVFLADIKAIIDGVAKGSPDTEFVVVSGITPIPYWAHSHVKYLEEYDAALKTLAGPHVAVADVRSVWLYLLEGKNYMDLSGNGINHPNDFGHQMYGDVLSQTVLGNTNTQR